MRKRQIKGIFSGAILALGLLGSLFFSKEQPANKPNVTLPSARDFRYVQSRVEASEAKTTEVKVTANPLKPNDNSYELEDEAFYIPRYTGKLSVLINDNEPIFANLVDNFQAYYVFSDLDKLGRVGSAEALLGPETLPRDKRKSIRQVIPSGWHQGFYSFIEQQALYTRAHLIAHQLCGENATKENLMTGTAMFNVDGMLPYENKVKHYIKQTNNHVQYRVTPVFGYFDYNENNLVADGVQMEALSVEDGGAGVKFNVFVYNVQTGVDINYLTGENKINAQGKKMGFEIKRKSKNKK